MHAILVIHVIFFASVILPFLADNKSPTNGPFLTGADNGCRLYLREDLPDPLPLILTIEDNPRFVIPDVDGFVRLKAGGGVRLVCTGPENVLPASGYQDVNIDCVEGTTFTVPTNQGYKQSEFVDLGCAKQVENTARYKEDEDPNCPSPLLPFEIGFTLPKDEIFILLYDGCFDGRRLDAVYSRFVLSPSFERNASIPFAGSLAPAGFYDGLNPNAQYSPDVQRKVVSELLGSSELGSKYINVKEGHFLSPGLLTTDGDFVYSSQKNATYYFVNSVPQWQYADSKNWYDLDFSLREFASKNGYKLIIWTGSYGMMTLADSNGTQKGLSIFMDKNGHNLMNVPALLWRVAIDPKTAFGVAFVSVNNPYLKTTPKSLILCDSICNKLEWLRWSPEITDGGYCYCCEIVQLRKAIYSIPDLEVKGLLGQSTSHISTHPSFLLLKLIVVELVFTYVENLSS